MDLYEAIKKRRDVRSYCKGDPIPDEVLAKLLLSAHLGPSVGYSQPWNFIIIKDEKIKRRIKELVDKEREEFKNLLDESRKKIFDNIKIDAIMESPINLAVTCDFNRFGPHVLGRRTIPETCNYSTVLAIENLWLAATAEGIGVGWVSFFKKEDVKKILGIPDNVELIAYLTLCYVTKFPEVPELEEKGWNKRLPLEELVFENQWNNKPNERLLNVLRNAKI
ncbi:5,6-dimethylbenzimidazole synthase [Sulfurisphaera javensis]|uniref:5,6-dimethylbenzimidazole synthase n=1 Tax=Sulfurisphaera javensis TaxID=2049879 RepID=A0AAT9GS89_9CREN